MGDISYRPLIEDMVWSYSRIKCFDDCPYKWFLKYIKGYKEKPMFYSSYGKFIHKLIEMYNKKLINREEMLTKFLFDFSSEVQGDKPSASIVENSIKSGIKYINEFEDFPFNTIGVEEKVDFVLDGIPLLGFIDYLGEKDGEFYIIDNKSRQLKPRSERKNPMVSDKELDEMLRQLYLYAGAVEQKYGKFPKELCFNCFKNQTFIREPFIKDKYTETLNWAKQNIEQIKETDRFSPHVDYFYCNYICGLSDDCCYYQMR